MTTHTVQVIPDDEWREAVGSTSRGLLTMTEPRRLLIEAIAEGPLSDSSGRASVLLWDRMVKRGYGGKQIAMNGLLLDTSMRYAIRRDLKGKRCFHIELERIPARWEPWLGREAAPVVEAPIEVPPIEEEPTPPPAEEVVVAPDYFPEDVSSSEPESDLGALRLIVSEHVAAALLTRVTTIIGTHEEALRAVAERDEARERLATALEEHERQRKRLTLLGEELAATKTERDGLRTRLRMCESNLGKLTGKNGDVTRLVDELVHQQLDRVMRETPHPSRRGA